MTVWQTHLLQILIIISSYALIHGFVQTSLKKNPFGLTRHLTIIGAFVWGDALIFGFFWLFISSVCLYLQNFKLILVTYSIFWIVRSIGETIYWLNQQFTTKKRDKPQDLFGHRLFPGESIYFAYQIFWQCVTVVSILATLYLLSHSLFFD